MKYCLFTLRIDWLAESCGHSPASWESIVLQSTSPGKDQNIKFQVQFLLNMYCFSSMAKLKIRSLTIVCHGLWVHIYIYIDTITTQVSLLLKTLVKAFQLSCSCAIRKVVEWINDLSDTAGGFQTTAMKWVIIFLLVKGLAFHF